MKTFGEIVGKFFNTLFSIVGVAIKSAWWLAIGCVVFSMAVFILAVFFNSEVQGAIEIFKNVLQIP